MRLNGASYEEVARAGGGIVSSVKALRAASEDELVRQSLPRLDARVRTKLQAIGGRPPNMLGDLRGCPFAARCRFATSRCHEENPALAEVAPDHAVACWHDQLTHAEIRQ